ncbi:MAG TPA: hypothetical protein VNT30_10425 [Stellaceae bacterium]|nr:hypothetical protein [Stellaceae bacterium]
MTQLIDGAILRMGGRDWTIPPLTFGQIKRLRPLLEAIPATASGVLTGDQLDAIVAIVHAALGRNYPDVTFDQVGDDLLDLGNMAAVVNAVMTGSGLVSSGVTPSGEAPAGQV